MAKSKFDSATEPAKLVHTDTLSPMETISHSDTNLDLHEIATDIVQSISHELHVRVGIGPIWRQLNAARKEEIINAWVHKTEDILSKALTD